MPVGARVLGVGRHGWRGVRVFALTSIDSPHVNGGEWERRLFRVHQAGDFDDYSGLLMHIGAVRTAFGLRTWHVFEDCGQWATGAPASGSKDRKGD